MRVAKGDEGCLHDHQFHGYRRAFFRIDHKFDLMYSKLAFDRWYVGEVLRKASSLGLVSFSRPLKDYEEVGIEAAEGEGEEEGHGDVFREPVSMTSIRASADIAFSIIASSDEMSSHSSLWRCTTSEAKPADNANLNIKALNSPRSKTTKKAKEASAAPGGNGDR